MPSGTCDPASRGQAYNETSMEYPLPNRSGSVLVTIRYGWDGSSVMPDCDGPISYVRTRNTGTQTAWALLPKRRKSPQWIQIDPGTDSTITAKGQLNNLGLSSYSDALDAAIAFAQPA